jgi:Zn-dependent M28 family amino/carboxypeptidase
MIGVARRARGRRPVVALAAALGLLLATLGVAPTVSASPYKGEHGKKTACEHRNNNTYQKLLECITLEGVLQHQQELQKIADSNDDPHYSGTRAAGTKGYADSVEYVASLLEDAGYSVTLDPFEFQFTFPAVLQQLTPVSADYETGAFTGSGSGDVTTDVAGADLSIDDPAASTSGCEPEDFAGFPAGSIALIQRGGCSFAAKALNAEAAGATGVIIFNTGDIPTRMGLIVGTLGGDDVVGIPVVGASHLDGVALAQEGSTAHVRVDPAETRTDYNVIAELKGKNDDNVVMAGAHLDSVTAGAGINDNGSGSSAILETALKLANHKPQNTMRFAWWGAEERGLLGSAAYVNGLAQDELDRIAVYMNYDMVGSPNYIFMAYDADQSTFEAPVPVPDGSEAIEDVYETYYTWVGEPYDDAAFSGRSDYQAFINNGIAAGGLFTGAEVVKTPEQVAIWGGTAGDQFDPCYHQACDTIDNLALHALEVNSDLIAFAQLTFAYSTESVNGVKGKKVPGRGLGLPEPAGPEGTFGSDGGGAHDHDHEEG